MKECMAALDAQSYGGEENQISYVNIEVMLRGKFTSGCSGHRGESQSRCDHSNRKRLWTGNMLQKSFDEVNGLAIV